MPNKKILITGADGFVGKNLCAHLLATYPGIEIKTYTRSNPCIPVEKVDTIIHCAAELRDERKMFDSNVKLTYGLLTVAKYDHFIHIGTSSEYNDGDRTLYAATKRAASSLVEHFPNTAIVNPWTLYGPGDREDKLLASIYRAWETKEPMKFYPDGIHDWVYIGDFAMAIADIMESRAVGYFDVGTGIQTTNAQILNACRKALVGPIPVEIVDSFGKHDYGKWPVCEMPMESFTSIDVGISKYVEWRSQKAHS